MSTSPKSSKSKSTTAKSKTTTAKSKKTAQPRKATQQKSDLLTVALWISGIMAFSYVLALIPSVARETVGNVPDSWFTYWAISGALYFSGLYKVFRLERIGAQLIIAASLADAVIPTILFRNHLGGSAFLDAGFNIAFAGLWIFILRRKPALLK
jgi:cation transport ATPase